LSRLKARADADSSFWLNTVAPQGTRLLLTACIVFGVALGSHSSPMEKLEQVQCFVNVLFNPLAPPLNQHY
jgi:hypothetical protein